MLRRIFTRFAIFIIALVGRHPPVHALVVASDDSGDAAYSSGWPDGSNGGNGYGAWALRSTSGNGGFFTSSATDNDAGGPSQANTINSGGDAFGLFANSGARAVAYRPFNLTTSETALQSGYTFSWAMDNGGVDDSGSSIGLSLRSGNANSDGQDSTIFSGRRFGVEFQQGSGDYKIIDATGTRDTGIAWRRTGLQLSLTLTSLDTYSLAINDVSTGTPVGAFTGAFAGTLGSALNSFAVYNRFAGSNGERNVYFNDFVVSAVPEATPIVAIPLAVLVVVCGVAISRRLASHPASAI